MKSSRRQFLQLTSVAALGAATGCVNAASSTASARDWPIGCFNRPWTKWGYDTTLEGIHASGYRVTGLLTRSQADPFIGADATPDYLAKLRAKIASHGLKANMGALRSRHDISIADSVQEVHRQIDNAKFLGLEFILTFGVDKPAQYDHYYEVMAEAAGYALGKSLKLVLKPHGGGSGAAEEILRCVRMVGHPNFKIWYDAGNIIYYTGKDPLTELEPIVEYVTGFCAKDCDKLKGDVMSQFGSGKVDFLAIFQRLKKAGFNGPIMVEGVKVGATPEETTANAKANREFLERVLALV
ncbi:MAG: sugar phosphate isomerase/epimerase [Opitutaceae bacterium]|nr:sugar phosphate isomerase/epimerase [Verrucomicrobiales bacterium]